MKSLCIVLGLLLATPVLAAKSCEELKAEIDAKIKTNGVPKYTLDIVPNAEVKDGKVIGSCDGGTHKIVYTK